MQAGKLKSIVTIEQAKLINGEYEETEIWVAFKKNVRCSIDAISGKKYFDALQNKSEITHEIWMYFVPGFTSKMRINDNGKIYQLISPPIDKKNKPRDLQIMVREIL